MALHRIPILGAATMPDTTGDVFFEPYNIKATNDKWRYTIAVFNDSGTRIGLYGLFDVPQNYIGTAKLVIVWSSTAITGDVEWDFDYRAVGGNDVESLDQTGVQEAVNGNDTAPSAANERMEFSINLTSSNFVKGDTVQFFMLRDGSDAGDTMAAAAQLHNLFFEYSDI